MNLPKPPRGLEAAGRRLWRQQTGDWDYTEDSLTLLRQAAHCADSCDRLQALAAAEPPVIKSRLGTAMPNPVHVELRSERRLLLALLTALREPDAEASQPVLPGGLRMVL